MSYLLISVGILIISGAAALLLSKHRKASSLTGAAGVVVASVFGIYPAIRSLIDNVPYSIQLPWNMPMGSFSMGIDGISALFLLPIFILSPAAAIYGIDYVKDFRKDRTLGSQFFFFNLLVAGMALTVTARNGLLFLLAWELMSMSSFFLVACEHEKEEVRKAGWMYFTAMHLGTAFLFVMFVLFGSITGSLDFAAIESFTGFTPFYAGLLFILALIGFGTKAGIMPFHVWLPEAHPVAMSHVSALMSGVMIKTGIYGILRVTSFFGAPPMWWGSLVVGLGAASAVVAVFCAHGQKDIKRFLAYSSIENIGIICIGIGIGLIGKSAHQPFVAALGFGGALFHVVNHSLFKGVLFLGAGSVFHGTHSRLMDTMGGLMKRMPWTGGTFLIGAVAASALPPLNGFISEFLIYSGAFSGIIAHVNSGILPCIAAIGALAFAGGLAAAVFVKAFGIVFLGEPRTESSAVAHESGIFMKCALVVLSAGCIITGLLSPFFLSWINSATAILTGMGSNELNENFLFISDILKGITSVLVLLIGIFGAIALYRWIMMRKRKAAYSLTWDCGYVAPNARMQYTSSSFSQPLMELFSSVTVVRENRSAPLPVFPSRAVFFTEMHDVFLKFVFVPLFRSVERISFRLRVLQHGRVHLYILYIVIALLALLIWGLH